MAKTTYVDEIQDPVTGEFIILEADSAEQLDDLVAQRFDVDLAEEAWGR